MASLSLRFHRHPRRYRLVTANYNPALATLWLEFLPVPLPKNYSGGRAPITIREMSFARFWKFRTVLHRLGFTGMIDRNGFHYSRPVKWHAHVS